MALHMVLIPRGSSPHTRGTQWRAPGTLCLQRDHPRIRGEHLRRVLRAVFELGIIPAYAGNTAFPIAAFVMMWIIPAYAGNTYIIIHTSKSSLGSSPHTRGTPVWPDSAPKRSGDHPRIRGEHAAVPAVDDADRGIIPAYAGNTSRRACSGGTWPDHPRIRGEHLARL